MVVGPGHRRAETVGAPATPAQAQHAVRAGPGAGDAIRVGGVSLVSTREGCDTAREGQGAAGRCLPRGHGPWGGGERRVAGPGIGSVRRWPTAVLARYVAEHESPAEGAGPDRAVEQARIELARRLPRGTLEWMWRIEDPTAPDSAPEQLIVTLPIGVTEEQVRTAARAYARRRYGPQVQVSAVTVYDAAPAGP